MNAFPWIGAVAIVIAAVTVTPAAERPNVVLIMTDDQGYGDLAIHGHPHVITPNMDRLAKNSVRLEQFHVDPTCSPTRSALMTGRYSGRVGVWHTVMGRNMLREDETTIAQVFQAAGYRTGVYGKWHLGDSYPYGARFRGFDDAIVHFAGGVGQSPDYWDNDYFEDHYHDNGSWRPFQGYCTDVWFREALRFIRENREQPFFVYLPTNAAHQTRPHVPERYKALYDDLDVSDRLKIFWGMLTNIDDNLGILLDRLEHWDLMDNTVLIFMGDNGTTMGPNFWPPDQRSEWAQTFNAGMRGTKGSHYDGGHRLFCFVQYPAGGIGGGRQVRPITAHIDLMPTLLELCGIDPPEGVVFDGKSLVPLLTGDDSDWPQRTIFLQNQRVLDPIKWKHSAVMTDRWRLVSGGELYDMRQDPGQQQNVIDDHPQVAQELSDQYDRWWDEISQRFDETTPLYIGAQQQPSVQLSSHDWMTPDLRNLPWNQPHVRQRPLSNGPWRIRVARAGRYAFVLRERPEVAEFPLTATEARLRIGDLVDERQAVPPDATGIRFEVRLPAGDMELQTWLIESDQTSRGAYYVQADYLGD
ncbi:MAG: N-acetylgalactosamine 6-sulfate sulfatase [Planctomycetaceae bacterium]|nr:MAG: N-acetylgalactosamine 6-sulfate sulfatase [Planctomycetaceae bacterium]